MSEDFPHLKSQASEFLSHPERCYTRQGMVELVCRDCPFWKEDEKDDYECAGFRLLRFLLHKGVVSVEAILNALGD